MPVRAAAVGGVVFFVLTIINGSGLSGAPSATDSGPKVVDYVTQHQSRLQLGAVLLGLAMAAVLVWLPALIRVVGHVEGESVGLALIALAGGVLAAASTVTGALVEGITANRIGDLGPAGARVCWTAYLLSYGATLLGLMLVIGATAVACLQTHLFARWFVTASVVLTLVSAFGAFGIGYAAAAIQVVTGLALVLDVVWILLVSIFLWRDPTLALPERRVPV